MHRGLAVTMVAGSLVFIQPFVAAAASIDLNAIESADLTALIGEEAKGLEPAVVKLQVLLDRAGVSPGVIDGVMGENVEKALLAIEKMNGLKEDGVLDADLIAALEDTQEVVQIYQIRDKDVSDLVDAIPEDYAEKAQMKFLGFTSGAEAVAERFHMDLDLLVALNPDASFAAGEKVLVADVGSDKSGKVVRIEADKERRQVRAYDAKGNLVVAYPATIGSSDNPSPTGAHKVNSIALMPTYTYNPELNFQQGDNDKVLEIPPGPNGPVGSVWIDLSEPTYGIHGSPEPSLIDKVNSHGCIRLTNWDAEELAGLVGPGVEVAFVP